MLPYNRHNSQRSPVVVIHKPHYSSNAVWLQAKLSTRQIKTEEGGSGASLHLYYLLHNVVYGYRGHSRKSNRLALLFDVRTCCRSNISAGDLIWNKANHAKLGERGVHWYNTGGYNTLKLICMAGKILRNRSSTRLQTKKYK